MELKPAICPICGGDLRLPENKKILKCMYCGKDIIVQEAIAKAMGPTIDNMLILANSAMSSRNFKEAYNYYTRILELNPNHYEAWIGKAESAGWQGTIADSRFKEIMDGVTKAINLTPDELKKQYKLKASQILYRIAASFYQLSNNHMFEYGRLQNVANEHATRCEEVIDLLVMAKMFDPDNKQIISDIISIYKSQLEGTKYKDFNEYGEFTAVSKLTDNYAAIVKKQMDQYIDEMKKLDPSYQTPVIKKSGCFIVTATMGSENHPHVLFLRVFRDNWLSVRSIGRLFIEKYYHFSPYLAEIISQRKVLRKMVYVLIVLPSVNLARKLLKK